MTQSKKLFQTAPGALQALQNLINNNACNQQSGLNREKTNVNGKSYLIITDICVVFIR